MTIQLQNNNLNYLIEPTFKNVNRLFVSSRNNACGNRDSILHYYVPTVKIKYFYVLFDKNFLLICQQKVKKKFPKNYRNKQ